MFKIPNSVNISQNAAMNVSSEESKSENVERTIKTNSSIVQILQPGMTTNLYKYQE